MTQVNQEQLLTIIGAKEVIIAQLNGQIMDLKTQLAKAQDDVDRLNIELSYTQVELSDIKKELHYEIGEQPSDLSNEPKTIPESMRIYGCT